MTDSEQTAPPASRGSGNDAISERRRAKRARRSVLVLDRLAGLRDEE